MHRPRQAIGAGGGSAEDLGLLVLSKFRGQIPGGGHHVSVGRIRPEYAGNQQ